MKDIITAITKRTASAVIPMIVVLFASSCMKTQLENSHDINVASDELVTLCFKASGNAGPATKGLSHEQENDIVDIDVLVFKGDPTNPRVVFQREGAAISTGAAINEKNFQVTLPLSTSSDTKLIVLANSRAEIAAVGGIVGKTYAEVQTMLGQSINGKLYTLGGAIPMWGETPYITIASGTTISITLYRAVARVDIGLGRRTDTGVAPSIEYSWNGLKADGMSAIPFTLDEIYLISPNDKISLMPTPSNWTAVPKLPTVMGNRFDFASSQSGFKFSGVDIMSGLFTTQSIYLPESDILMGAAVGTTRPGGTNHSNRTALVVGGKYNNGAATTYYRIDFTQAGFLVNVLRNHLFLISITNITGPGYNTPEEAYNASSMNINTDVEIWDEESINDVEFDGQYYYGIEKREVTFTPMGGESVMYKVRTNVPDWSISSTTAEVLNAAGTRTYENPTLGFKYTIADGAEPNTYTLTVSSTKHNILATPLRREELLDISAKRLKLAFKTMQESTDLFVGRQTSYRYYPEGSSAVDQISIDVASLTSVNATASDTWIHIASNTIIREADGVYRGTITATVPHWLQANGTTDRMGVISIAPVGRPAVTSLVTQEAPYIQFSEASVIVRELLTRAADYSKALQVRTNLKVGTIDLTADHTGDPTNKFSLVNPGNPFTYPDSYYPRYASMTVQAAVNSVALTNGATVVYTAKGSVASTFWWISSSSTLIIQPANTLYKWQWSWDANWNPAVQYVIPWHFNSVSLNVGSNRGASYDLSHSWTGGQINPSGASIGAITNGTETGSKVYPITFTIPVKGNVVSADKFGIWLKSNDALGFPVGIPVEVSRGVQVFSRDGVNEVNWPWHATSTMDVNLTGNVDFSVAASGQSVGVQQPVGNVWETNIIRSWKSNTPQNVTGANTNGTTTQSLRVGTAPMTVANLNNANAQLVGDVVFANTSGGVGAPVPAKITVKQYTPQLRFVSHTIPDPIPSAGGTYTVVVNTNIADVRAVSDNLQYIGGAVWGPINGSVSQTGGAQQHTLNVTIPANVGAERSIYFDVRTQLNLQAEMFPWNIKQMEGIKKLTLDYQGRGGPNTTTHHTVATSVPLPNSVVSGITFDGWNTKSDGSGTNYSGGANYVMPDNDVTLYAIWLYTVTFEGNGNTGNNGMSVSQRFRANVPGVLLENKFTHTDATFAGWSTASTGNATVANISNYTATSNVTLYARWHYAIGAAWPNRNSPLGVVTTAGINGSVISSSRDYKTWGPLGINTPATSLNNGYSNQDIMITVGTIVNYPAFLSCQNIAGTRWYLPAKEQLELIYVNRNIVVPAMQAIGGFPFEINAVIWTSTQNTNDNAFALRWGDAAATAIPKTNQNGIRCMKNFTGATL